MLRVGFKHSSYFLVHNKCRSVAAAGHKVTATMWNLNDSNSQFRLVLAAIDSDLAQGRLGETEAQVAKAELAREMLRQQAEAERPIAGAPQFGKGQLLLCIGIVAALALGSYVFLGSPAMPSQPLTGRADVATANIDLEDALAKIEAQLAKTPDCPSSDHLAQFWCRISGVSASSLG